MSIVMKFVVLCSMIELQNLRLEHNYAFIPHYPFDTLSSIFFHRIFSNN